ncbi:MAG: TetR-like C-terminal domain-containing protein [Mycolicibacterium insubricum]|nr:TetR/AcrR family transcriptional regulator C-terminal ligand-binding domain-containing protein [Mycobacterium sp.]
MRGLGRRGEALRRAVLDAAIDEVVAAGADAATVANISRRAGVHETSVYRRWQTRENLILEALLERSGLDIPAPDTGSLRGDLVAIARSVGVFIQSPVGRALLRAAAQTGSADETGLQAFWRARRAALEGVIDRAKARGELDQDADGSLLVEALVAPLHLRILLSREQIETDLPERLADLVLRGAQRG